MATAADAIGIHRVGRASSHDPSRHRSRSAPVKETVRQDVVDGYEYLASVGLRAQHAGENITRA